MPRINFNLKLCQATKAKHRQKFLAQKALRLSLSAKRVIVCYIGNLLHNVEKNVLYL